VQHVGSRPHAITTIQARATEGVDSVWAPERLVITWVETQQRLYYPEYFGPIAYSISIAWDHGANPHPTQNASSFEAPLVKLSIVPGLSNLPRRLKKFPCEFLYALSVVRCHAVHHDVLSAALFSSFYVKSKIYLGSLCIVV